MRLTSRPVQKQVGKEDEGPTKGDKAINVAKSSGAAIGTHRSAERPAGTT